MRNRYTFTSNVVVYQGVAAWRFIGLPQQDAEEIREKFGKTSKAWGSLPVRATIGNTTWETSLFPDSKSGTYLLPLKAEVRKKEGIVDSATVVCDLELR